MLSFDQVDKRFDDNVVLQDLSFSLAPQESFAIVGPSGVGKSVIVKLILGTIPADQGKIIVLDCDLKHDRTKYHRKMADEVGVLFQNGALFDSLSVFENIGFVDLQRKKPLKKIRNRVASLLYDVGLNTDLMDVYPSSLSGGMRKRVALARALAQKPSLLLCDEPTTGLDPITSARIAQLLSTTIAQLKISCLTITHDMSVAKTISDRIAMLYNGNFLWQGTPEQLEKSKNSYVRQFREGKSDGPIKRTEAKSEPLRLEK